MHLKILLPPVQPEVYVEPTVCPLATCGGNRFHLHQSCVKPVRDTVFKRVTARRYECLRCGHTFRVYPIGISHNQVSARLKGVAILLYLMGLSYGAVALTLQALGWTLSKTAVYDAVQAAGERVPGLRRSAVPAPANVQRVAAVGMDVTSVKCAGAWLSVGVGVDAVSGLTLTIDLLDTTDAATLAAWVHEVATAVEAQVLVSDDADGFKTAADAAGLAQQVCKAHVLRNTEALVAELTRAIQQDHDGSLAVVGVNPTQATADLASLLALTRSRLPTAVNQLADLHRRYLAAAAPKKDTKASVAYRLRLLFLDRWNLWNRLTFYRTWQGAQHETLDGTNNATERTIGWDIKERYRSMRGYKRAASVLNVSRLIAWVKNEGRDTGAALVRVIA